MRFHRLGGAALPLCPRPPPVPDPPGLAVPRAGRLLVLPFRPTAYEQQDDDDRDHERASMMTGFALVHATWTSARDLRVSSNAAHFPGSRSQALHSQSPTARPSPARPWPRMRTTLTGSPPPQRRHDARQVGVDAVARRADVAQRRQLLLARAASAAEVFGACLRRRRARRTFSSEERHLLVGRSGWRRRPQQVARQVLAALGEPCRRAPIQLPDRGSPAPSRGASARPRGSRPPPASALSRGEDLPRLPQVRVHVARSGQLHRFGHGTLPSTRDQNGARRSQATSATYATPPIATIGHGPSAAAPAPAAPTTDRFSLLVLAFHRPRRILRRSSRAGLSPGM